MEYKSFRIEDLAGNAVSGATVNVYETGTTTHASGLQDFAGGAVSSPLTGDAVTGKVGFRAPNGTYDIVMEKGTYSDALYGVEFFDIDDADIDQTGRYGSMEDLLDSTAPARGEGSVWSGGVRLFTEAASGAFDYHEVTAGGVGLYEAGDRFTTRARAQVGNTLGSDVINIGSLAFKLDPSGTALATGDGETWSPAGEITILHWGADRLGISDCQPAVQAAVAYVCGLDYSSDSGLVVNVQGGGELVVPAGYYRMDSKALYIETSSRKINFQLRGEGIYQSTLFASAINTTGIIDVSVSGGNEMQGAVRDLALVCTAEDNGTALRFACDPVGLSRQHRVTVSNLSVRPLNADGAWFNYGVRLNGFYYPYIENSTVSGPYGPSYTGTSGMTEDERQELRYGDDSVGMKCLIGWDLTDCYDPTLVNVKAWSVDTAFDMSNGVGAGEGGALIRCGASAVRVGVRRYCIGREPGWTAIGCHFNYRDQAFDFINVKDIEISECYTFNMNLLEKGTGGVPNDYRFRGCQDVSIALTRFGFDGDPRRQTIRIEDSDGTGGRQAHKSLDYKIVNNEWSVEGTFDALVRVISESSLSPLRRVLKQFEGNTWDEDAISDPIVMTGTQAFPVIWSSTKDGEVRFQRTNASVVARIANDGDMRITNNGVSAGETADTGADTFVMDSTQGNFGISFMGSATCVQNIFFGRPGNPSVGRFQYNHAADVLSIRAGGKNVMTMNAPTADNTFGAVLLGRLSGADATKRLEMGAADSGGSGYRTVRVLN